MMAQAAPPAAVVSKIEGNAVASQGERYVTVHDGMRLVEGDRLMVLEGGQAVVTFNDGCRLDLPEMAILSVQAGSICALNGVGVYQPAPESGVASGTPPNPSWRRLVPERPVAKRNATWRQGTITPTMTAIATSGATTLTRMTTIVLAVGWPGLVALGGCDLRYSHDYRDSDGRSHYFARRDHHGRLHGRADRLRGGGTASDYGWRGRRRQFG
jgi:hypothetical protein